MTKLSEPILMGLSDKIANTCMLSESELSEVKIKPILKEWKGLAQALEAEVERVGQLNHCNLVGLGMKNKALETENKKLREMKDDIEKIRMIIYATFGEGWTYEQATPIEQKIAKIDNIIYPKYYQSKDENQAPPEGGSDG